MIVGWNVTHRILPVRVFSIASPPPGTLLATRTAAADATTWRPRYDSMATSTMQATKGGIINWMPLITPPSSVRGSAAAGERAQQLGDPEVHEVEVRIHPRGTPRIGGHDHALGPGFLRHFENLIAIVIVRG